MKQIITSIVKPLEISEDHKVKLVKMARKLFPEYIEIRFQIISKQLISGTLKDWEKKFVRVDEIMFTFHWFEFTFLLLERLMQLDKNPIEAVKFIQKYGMICYNHNITQHPIDYLWEEFKTYKLK